MDLLNKIPIDKQLHFLSGGMIGGILSNRPLLGIGAVVAAALGKELYDYLYNKITKTAVHVPDPNDACATFMGGIIAIVLANIVNYLI